MSDSETSSAGSHCSDVRSEMTIVEALPETGRPAGWTWKEERNLGMILNTVSASAIRRFAMDQNLSPFGASSQPEDERYAIVRYV